MPGPATQVAFPGSVISQSVTSRVCLEKGDCRVLSYLSKKQTCFSSLSVTFCLILCKGSNKHLVTCQKGFLRYFHRKMGIIVSVVCTLHCPGSFDFYHEGEGGQDKEMEEKYSSGESGADC